jgi:ribosomal protein L11 methyltransferase
MPTFSALTTLPARDPAAALAAAIEDLDPAPIGVGIFEIEDGSGRFEVGAYFDTVPDHAGLALLGLLHGTELVVSEVPDTDWVAHVRRELRPVEAGRFFVHGSHDAGRVPPGRVALLIEAAMAFGTGHHGTTLGCLRAIDRLGAEGFSPARITDIGCGTAVLAMAAAHLWSLEGDRPVIASDNDPVAVEVAAANVRANGLDGRVICLEAEGFDHPEIAAAAPLDLVLANILKAPLIALAPDMARMIAPGGVAILSGLLNEQGDEIVTAYRFAGFRLHARDEIGEWTTLVLTRDQ